jgi:membrane protein
MGRLRRIHEEAQALTLRESVRLILRGWDEHDVLTFASALAFRVLFSIIPLTLLGVGLLGGLGLEEEWTSEWGPRVRETVSDPVFQAMDDTARRVLGERQTFWLTAGAAFAVWAISGATRTIMDVLDRIYGSRRERSFSERVRVSLLLGLGVAALLLGAVGSVTLGDDLLRAAGLGSPVLAWLRWPVALALLFSVIALLIARAPVDHQPLHWVSFGSVLIVAAWVGTSVVLAWYLTAVADYGSVFGALATVVVALSYLYFASAAFLTGALLDAIVRRRVER